MAFGFDEPHCSAICKLWGKNRKCFDEWKESLKYVKYTLGKTGTERTIANLYLCAIAAEQIRQEKINGPRHFTGQVGFFIQENLMKFFSPEFYISITEEQQLLAFFILKQYKSSCKNNPKYKTYDKENFYRKMGRPKSRFPRSKSCYH